MMTNIRHSSPAGINILPPLDISIPRLTPCGAIIKENFLTEMDGTQCKHFKIQSLKIGPTKKFLRNVKPSLVVDAAAKVGGIGANNSKPVEFLTENLQIQSNLMAAAFSAEVEKFVFLGSSCIYPRDCEQPIKEVFLMSGVSTKYGLYNGKYGFYTVLNLTVVYKY
jgi:UDP-glucose 4-epimerase